MTNISFQIPIYGKLAKEYLGVELAIKVMNSQSGYYIGTSDDEGPVSRESLEYWSTHKGAADALEHGDWTQREEP